MYRLYVLPGLYSGIFTGRRLKFKDDRDMIKNLYSQPGEGGLARDFAAGQGKFSQAYFVYGKKI